MTAAEVKRLEKFLAAQQAMRGEDVVDEESLAVVRALFRMPTFSDIMANICQSITPTMLAHVLALMFRLGQKWERSEQMRREFGDAEVPR